MKPFQGIRPYRDPKGIESIKAEIAFPDDEIHIERRVFSIHTYSNLCRKEQSWEYLALANNFIATLDKDEYHYLVRLFVQAKRFLNNVKDRETLEEAIIAIDEKVAKTFGRLALPERIFDFVCKDNQISLPDFTNIGNRPQDTEDKTFLEDDYHMINTIVVISKILFPIFGEIISKIQNPSINSACKDQKEIVAFGILNTLMVRDFNPIVNKLFNYINQVINKKLPDIPMVMFRGITEISYVYDIMATMIVKNLVNQDLYRERGNIMTYISSTLKRILTAEPSGSNKSITYKPRILQEQGGDDGRNLSLMENAINVNDEPVETPILVKIAIDRFIDGYLKKNNIKLSVFESAVNYYRVKLIPPSPINELLVAMFVADPIGSAYCVRYMNMDMMVRVIVLLQIYMIKMGFKELVPMVSLIDTQIQKTDIDVVDNAILMSEGRGSSGMINYNIHLKDITSHLNDFSFFKLDEIMKELYMFVVNTNHIYSVAPSILELSDTGSTYMNDQGYLKYNKDIIGEITRFMYHLLISNSDRTIEAKI